MQQSLHVDTWCINVSCTQYLQSFLNNGCKPVEKRRGECKMYSERKAKVESHYTNCVRQYFPSDGSIKKMWNMHNSEFQEVFKSDFNISFKTPATDVCSQCIRLKASITNTKNAEEKALLITKLRVHK